VADFDGQPLDRTGDDAQRREEHGVAVARDDLGGHRLDRQAQLLGDIFLHRGSMLAKCRPRPKWRRSRFRRAPHEPRAAAVELGIGLGQLDAERGRFGMDAVAAADGGRVLVFHRAALERGEQVVDVGEQHVRGAGELHREQVSSTSELVMP
jgi:hypothetical protein